MTPLHCPHCRRPIEGELEHGVCPVPDRPVEVQPHVWRVYRREEDFGEPLTPRRLWLVRFRSWIRRVWDSEWGFTFRAVGVGTLVSAALLALILGVIG